MAETAVREAAEDDLAALAGLDTTYRVGERFLSLHRSGDEPELTFSLAWQRGSAQERTYDELTEEGLRRALTEVTDLFLVAELEGRPAGYLMMIVPRWTDAGEITDLVVDRPARRRRAGQALVDAAAAWGRKRGLRALWVEPRADNDGAIAFYLSLGFRISGVNDRWTSNADGEATIYMYLGLR